MNSTISIKTASIKGELTEKEQDDDSTALSTYQMKPNLSDIFKVNQLKEIIQTVLNNTLQGKTYNSDDAFKWTTQIAEDVSSAVEKLNMRRYKHVVQVTVGQELGSGFKYIARCRWDAECDNQASDIFTNATLFCVCTVFGIYLY